MTKLRSNSTADSQQKIIKLEEPASIDQKAAKKGKTAQKFRTQSKIELLELRMQKEITEAVGSSKDLKHSSYSKFFESVVTAIDDEMHKAERSLS